jgi:hypothetical protein
MERPPPPLDHRALRAARSLDVNRRRLGQVTGRIERASATLTSYLGLYGIAYTRLGAYEIALSEGELVVTRLPAVDGVRQLPLPDPPVGQVSEVYEPRT